VEGAFGDAGASVLSPQQSDTSQIIDAARMHGIPSAFCQVALTTVPRSGLYFFVGVSRNRSASLSSPSRYRYKNRTIGSVRQWCV
jgi:hypothetical protein